MRPISCSIGGSSDLIVFHAYEGTTGKPALHISTLTWKGKWAHAALGTSGEAK